MIMNQCSAKSGLIALVVTLLASACAQTPEQPSESAVEPPPLTSAGGGDVAPRNQGVVRLRPDHPQRYTVQPGDTLLDVAQVFLDTPWRWDQVWLADSTADRQIYAGDVIELYEENGQPRLRLIPASEPPIIKLSPQVRVEEIARPIPTVPRSAIESFVLRSIVVNKTDWENAPIIVGNEDDRVNMGTGARIYVKGREGFDFNDYRIFRGGRELRDPATGRFLGFDGIYVGDAHLEDGESNPATFLITRSRNEVQRGDRLFEVENEDEAFSFTPHPAPPDTEGQIVAVLGDSVNARQYGSVIVNIGLDDGAEPGQMLATYSPERLSRDPWAGTDTKLPGNRNGMIMLYKVYDAVSYALVTHMSGTIRANDRVVSPES
ncbi:MAG: LysM peptidoglycan-binding domain-containing protein [Gammaproteobacteria bacterium]|nr:LysM peptidoglycan-binding domain-containing protein [Gammaproteobacteria bacterium]